jgi:hypothetical protein
MRHWPLGELGYAIGFIAAALVLYVTAYLLLIHRMESDLSPIDPRLYPHYGFGGETSSAIFGPAQAVDEKLFPDRWVNHDAEKRRKELEEIRRKVSDRTR